MGRGVYRAPSQNVEWYETKYDGFKIEATGKEYRQQKGSGRSIVFGLITPGMTIGEWTKAAAAIGFDPNFVIGSLDKHQRGATAAYCVSEEDDKGRSYAEVKLIRKGLTPEERAQKSAELKAAREKAKAEREAAAAAGEAPVKRKGGRRSKNKGAETEAQPAAE